MNKRDFFVAAMKAGNYKYLDWLFSVFCLSKDEPENAVYSYQVKSTPAGYFFMNDAGEMEKIEDAVPGAPILGFKEKLTLVPGDIPNAPDGVETVYGNVIANWLLLVSPFGTKINFMTGKIKIGDIEDIILTMFEDDPADPAQKSDKKIYVSEYLKFAESCFALTGFTQMCVWCNTEKNMLPPDGLKEFKEKLFEEYARRLGDAVAIAEMDAKLVAFDKAWRAGDEGNNFLLSGKTVNIVRKKKFLMHGGEVGPDGNTTKMTLIKNSLEEGWDVNAFPAINNTLRMGSFARGAETMLGGVEVKWAQRASANMAVTVDDCGSTLGVNKVVSEGNYKRLIGFSLILGKGLEKIENEEQAKSKIGQRVSVRSPMYCKLDKTDFCKTCVGDRLAATPFALSTAVSAYGSTFMMISMSANHGKALSIVKLDLEKTLF